MASIRNRDTQAESPCGACCMQLACAFHPLAGRFRAWLLLASTERARHAWPESRPEAPTRATEGRTWSGTWQSRVELEALGWHMAVIWASKTQDGERLGARRADRCVDE